MTRSKRDSLSSPTAASPRATAMPKSCLFIAVLVALSFTLGCNKKPKGAAEATTLALTPEETLAQQAINLLNEATQLMTSVRDRASAAAAAPRLKDIARQLQDLNRRGVPLGSEVRQNPQPLGRLRDDMERAVQRYADLAVRLLAQENVLGPELQDALRELGKLPQ